MKTETQQKETFVIPQCNMARLDKEFVKLNKRAAKIGCPGLMYETKEITYVPDRDKQRTLKKFYRANSELLEKALASLPLIEMHEIEIIGEGPVVKDYKFVGKLDHATLPGSVLVMTVPGEKVPARFFDAPPICDHCNKQRIRNATFVFQHESGEYKQVGRSCLRDFFGHDPSRIARYLEYLWALCSNLSETEWTEPSGKYVPMLYAADKLLQDATAMIRTFGWVSVTRAREDDSSRTIATAWLVSDLYDPPKDEKRKREWLEWRSTICFAEAEDKNESSAARNWLSEQEPKNEYIHNLRMLAEAEYIPGNMFGLWISLIATYQRSKETLKEAARQQKLNEHWGTVKVRAEVEVECTDIIGLPGNEYGPVTLHKMLTKEGHSLSWFASSNAKFEKGDIMLVKATVKKHDEYKGWANTIVNRVAVVKHIDN